MSKIAKKGRNPGAVDGWLDSLGLYRKNIAYDETCLFRAICEQVFGGQVYHERVRKECIAYARKSYKEFVNLGIGQKDWFIHLNELEKHMVVCGDIELCIISRKYNRDIIIFDASKQMVFDFTKRNLPEVFLLCLLDKDHYDVIFKKDYIATYGFCQSVIYKVLYEKVFKIFNVEEIVNHMLYDKNIITQSELEKKNMLDEECNSESLNIQEESDELEEKSFSSTNLAPFPFKVAKALDPTIYRNIEYDSWGEVRREMRLGDWYYGDNKLILGTKCIFNDDHNNEKLECYIQDITKDQNKCVIYITKMAEKRTVNYSDLSPEDGAKPWPLPYRFMKNIFPVNGSLGPVPSNNDKVIPRPKRRTKDKKRTKSESSIMSASMSMPFKCDAIENIEDYIGAPAIMHNPNEITQDHSEISTTVHTETNTFLESPINSQQDPVSDNMYNWDSSHWQSYMTPTQDPFIFPQSPMAHNPFNFKPMVASAPVTPNVIPYHDQNYPFYYNYHVEPYQAYPQWSSPPFELQPPPPPRNDSEKRLPPENQDKVETPQQEMPNVNTNSKNEVNNNNEIQSPVVPSQERMLTFTPQSPSVEVYPSIIPFPPGTPVVYTHAPPDLSEMVLPMTPVMYTELPHMSPTPFIYPPTPPATWYPAGVTQQGFIFPPQRN
ncbi:uncharacterized protein [Leptinotarsa decemlineata]|uniref:uncharacterized protein n=1 Tax=Leptinotarsa decemlineata TaxID=7539 RepID=UPI000C251E9C|nr:putative bifunctional UDP-N-acetylglucosamine transferase and deubiquitinase ALG13 [Leptinotarsa decemlineata]